MSSRLINRTERLTEIEQMLFHHPMGLRAVEIAEACGVDRRTIYRDVAVLNDRGIPVYQKDGRFFLNRDYYVANVRLNINESVALMIAARSMAHYAEQPNPHVMAAMKKLSRALPEAIATHALFLVETIRTDAVDRAFVTALEVFTRAWAEQRKVKLWYREREDSRTRTHEFATYFIETTSRWHLFAVGYDYEERRVRAFKLQRVKRVQMLMDSYETPKQFDRRRYIAGIGGNMREDFSGKPVEVVMLFATEVIPLIRERLLHSRQRVRITDDNRYLVRMQVGDWQELLPWIRSWGSKVEVLEPAALREALVAEASQVAAVYQAKTQE